MKDLVPEDYFGKKLKVYTYDGTVIVGSLYGYNYDYDDDGKEFMELDFRIPSSGMLREFRDDEIEKIVIIGELESMRRRDRGSCGEDKRAEASEDKMKKLSEYLYKQVGVTTFDGREYEGEMDLYSSAEDSGDEEDSIGIRTDEETGGGPLIFASEVKSIEEL